MTDGLPAVLTANLPAVVIEQLRQGAHDACGTMSPETIRAMRRGFDAFRSWCAHCQAPFLPAAPAAVVAYVDELTAAARKAAGIKQAVWSIGAVRLLPRPHRLAALPDPTKAEPVRQALKRMARQLGMRQIQAAPVNSYEIRRIVETAGERPLDPRDLALVLVMRDLLARRSEAVALDVATSATTPTAAGSPSSAGRRPIRRAMARRCTCRHRPSPTCGAGLQPPRSSTVRFSAP